MDEFRHFFYSMEHTRTLFDHLDDGTDCPACFTVPTEVYSFDADFQLVRKSSSGKQWDKPKHSGQFFLDQSEVDNFIDSYNKDRKKPNVDCSEFQAGSIIRSKRKNKQLSETAVFGSTCKHEYPKYFFSLKHGERLGYAVFLLNRLLEEQSGSKEKRFIMYDIACNLDSQLQKYPIPFCLKKVQFAIPIFHSYGHKAACQIHYGPRRTEGIGLTDGESLERLWSYLGKFSKLTKEMTPETGLIYWLMDYCIMVQKYDPSWLENLKRPK